jgi:hypothetical protein
MTNARLAVLADRKALLVTRANLDRLRVSVAVHEILAIVTPPRYVERTSSLRPTAAAIARIVVPIIGMTRFSKWLRVASIAMTVVRVVRNWNAPR